MNKNKYLAIGAAFVLTALSATSCTDGNDWGTDSSHARLFRATSISVAPSDVSAECKWTAAQNAEYYIIEISKDSLYDDIEMGASDKSIVYGEDKTITKSPFILTNLDSSSKYFLRVKAISSALESKWAYADDYSFKTRSEQIMKNVGAGDKTATAVTLYWIAGAKVTSIELVKGDISVKTINLSKEEIEAGTITIEGLEPLTTYKINLYNNDIVRGNVTFQTYADVPPADKIVYLSATDSINQKLFDGLAGYGKVTIALPQNAAFYNTSILTLPDNVSFTFYGLPGKDKPIIGIKQLNFNSNHGFIKFENIEISGYCIGGNGTTTQNDYFFNQSNATNVGTLEFNDCFIHHFKNSPIRIQGTATKIIDALIINNSIIYGAITTGSNSYSIIHVDANSGAGRINNITLTNSTVWYSGKNLILCNKYNPISIAIKNCTLSKLPSNGNYLIDCGEDANKNSIYGPDNGIIENCILGSTASETAKGIRSKKGSISISDCYATKDWVTNGNNISDLLNKYNGTEADLFVNPSAGDFTIKDSSFKGRSTCGDPRWRMND